MEHGGMDSPAQPKGCVPGSACILKGALSLPFILKPIKSQIRPGGGGGYRVKATGIIPTTAGYSERSRPAEAGYRKRTGR